MKKLLTLCYVFKEGKVLLGFKKQGFGVGRWNGFGGKVQENESIEDAARRELKEEAGLGVEFLREHGVLNFEFENDPDTLEVHVYSTSEFHGEPNESDEMRPEWFKLDQIPYDKMWVDDQYWMPLMLEGKSFDGKFKFRDIDTLLHHEINERVNRGEMRR